MTEKINREQGERERDLERFSKTRKFKIIKCKSQCCPLVLTFSKKQNMDLFIQSKR